MSVIWQDAISNLEDRINPTYYSIWMEPVVCTGVDHDTILLRAPNAFHRDWFSHNYLDIVLDEIQRTTRTRYQVHFEIDQDLPSAAPTTSPDPLPPAAGLPQEAVSCGQDPAPKPLAPEDPGVVADLLPRFTFDSFVVGPTNQLAHAAARAASEHPASRYNPIFIYGGAGLGKTHLLMAIGHEIHRRNPSWRVTYVSGERFINEYIASIRPQTHGDNRMDEFRRRYREDTDALLIDDIQFLAGKERTQEEFFHCFNSLYEAHKQIVLTSDKDPYEIDNLEDRLRSRFQWGLVADIQRPDLETRVAILRRKAELDLIQLPDDVALYLGEHIRSNVRELEGALIRIAASASLTGAPITVDFARHALRSLLTQDRAGLTMERIVKEVATYYHHKVADLRGPRRHQSLAKARQVAMYLSYQLLQDAQPRTSYPMVAEFFGGRDHTTVLSACRKITKLRRDDRSLRDEIDSLERILRR